MSLPAITALTVGIAISLLAFRSIASSYVLDKFGNFPNFGNFLLMLVSWLFLPFALFFSLPLPRSQLGELPSTKLRLKLILYPLPAVSAIRYSGAKLLVSIFCTGLVCIFSDILMQLYEWPGVEGAWLIASYVIKFISIFAIIASILFFGFGGLFCVFVLSVISNVGD